MNMEAFADANGLNMIGASWVKVSRDVRNNDSFVTYYEIVHENRDEEEVCSTREDTTLLSGRLWCTSE